MLRRNLLLHTKFHFHQHKSGIFNFAAIKSKTYFRVKKPDRYGNSWMSLRKICLPSNVHIINDSWLSEKIPNFYDISKNVRGSETCRDSTNFVSYYSSQTFKSFNFFWVYVRHLCRTTLQKFEDLWFKI